jgi:hypothetical protein
VWVTMQAKQRRKSETSSGCGSVEIRTRA